MKFDLIPLIGFEVMADTGFEMDRWTDRRCNFNMPPEVPLGA